MDPTEVTLPKVGEFTVVSMLLNCGMFKKFVDCAETSRDRPFSNGNDFRIDKFAEIVLGARNVFLPALPNNPVAGSVNAAVLNHPAAPGCEISTGKPVASARRLPL